MRRIIFGICVMLMALTATAQTEKFCIARNNTAATIVVDESDWKGVIRAANDLGDDVRKVTGVGATLNEKGEMIKDKGEDEPSILVGTIGKSRVIDRLVKQKKIDVRQVKGQWESYLIDVVDVEKEYQLVPYTE